jgi:hypothetical protein
MVRRFAFMVVAAGCGVGAYSIALGPPVVECSPLVELDGLVVGQTTVVGLEISNRHWVRSIRLADIERTCGCVEIGLGSRSLPPRSTATAHIEATPTPGSEVIASVVRFHQEDGRRIEAEVRGRVIPPFSGWPRECLASGDAVGGLKVDLDPAYVGAIEAVEAFDASGQHRVGANVESMAHMLIISPEAYRIAERGQLSLSCVIGRERPARWSGPVRIHEQPEESGG